MSALEIALRQTDASARRFDYLDVTLNAEGLRASTRIYNYYDEGDDTAGLPSFLRELALNWRGWRGEKRWESIEGDLKLTCTSDPLGRINVAVELRSRVADSLVWDVRCVLVLESWQLDALAAQAEKFFRR